MHRGLKATTWLAVCWLAAVVLATHAQAGTTYVWIEGEQPAGANVEAKGVGWGNQQYLSGEQWLHFSIDKQSVKDKVPAGGIVLRYEFDSPAGGYEVWNRVGFEFVRSEFDWRIDAGPWQKATPDMLTTDLMDIAFWCEVAWLKMGQADLKAGKHALEIRLAPAIDEKGQPKRILYACDAICLSKGAFHPNGPHKPDADWQSDADRAAGRGVFEVKPPAAGAPAGRRVTTPLAGQWQVARADEQDPVDRLGPIADPPKADELHWKSIAVPGDRNVERPELIFCHRYFYRTRVNVPAELAGRAFFLHFPSTNMVATVFVNGRQCGWNKAPFAAWDCDVTAAIRPGEVNEIAVGIKDTYYAVTRDTRRTFNVPPSLLDNNQGVSMRFDMPVWNHRQNGLLETPSLVAAGLAYTADVFAIPSVSKKRLGLEITLKNPSAQPVDVKVTNEVVPLSPGPAAKTFAPRTERIDAGGEKVIALAEGWAEARLWWPDDPQQYEVVTTLEVGGKPVDVTRTKFGFREWDWRGQQFKLNGVTWQGRADLTHHHTSDPELAVKTWRANGQTMVRFWGTHWGGMGMNATLDFYDSHGVPVRRSGIFDGEMASYGLTRREKRDGKDVNVANRDLFDNWVHQVLAQVRGERNHPSIFVWSIENEITYINSCNFGTLDAVEPEMTRAVEAVAKLDPTRPGMVDGGRALRDMSLPVNGCHYNDPDDRDLPDIAYDMKPIYANRHRGQWPMRMDRPAFFGESFFAMGRKPSAFAGVGGEACFLGRAETKEAVARLCRMMSEGYRWHGLAAFHYWMSANDSAGHYSSWQPVCALCREWNWTFAGGKGVRRTLKVFNDTRHDEPVELSWLFTLDGKTIRQSQATFKIAPGQATQTSIDLPVPAVSKRTRGELVLTCSRGGKEVFREVKELWVIDADGAPSPKVAAGEIAVFDPKGSVKARLQARKIPFAEVQAVTDAPPAAARLLIVGPDALTGRESTSPKWRALAAGGLRILVLDQASPLHYQAVPADLEPTDLSGRIAFSEDLQHPVFDGLDQPDFFAFSGDHVVYRNAYRKASRGARSLAQCDDELKCSALAECPVEAGLMLLSQFALGEKLATDGVAQRLFDNMVNYCLSYQLVRKSTAAVLADDTPAGRLLKDIQLVYDRSDDIVAAIDGKHPLVIAPADAATLKKLAANKPAFDAFTAKGGWLMLLGLTPEGLADFNRLVGVEHLLRPFERERVTLPSKRDPILSGLTMRDVVMESAQKIVTYAGDRWMADDSFTYLVDFDDVAPFARWPGPEHWNQQGAAPGGDHWPRNMVNGFVTSDSWRYIFSILLFKGEPTKWTIELPRAEQVVGLSIVPNAIYHRLTRMRLTFDGADSVDLDLQGDDNRQDFDFPPRKAKAITIELTKWQPKGTQDVIGVDNIWIRVRRPEEFNRRVVPLLNVGGLVKYKLGSGGVILNQLRIDDREAVPENRQKKATVTATLLRNLGAVFASRRELVPGAGLKYRPIPLGDKCNQYLTAGKDHWFRDEKGRAMDHFPIGEQKLAGVTYEVRDFKTSPLPACIMLQGGGRDSVRGAEWEVKDIAVGAKADALFFLHTFNRNDARDRKNYVAFRYVVHYADGSQAEIPVCFDEQIGHWALADPKGLKDAALAWAAPLKDDPAAHAAVYQMQWNNPRPDVAIQSIDVGYDPKSQPRAALGNPAVLAITAATRID